SGPGAGARGRTPPRRARHALAPPPAPAARGGDRRLSLRLPPASSGPGREGGRPARRRRSEGSRGAPPFRGGGRGGNFFEPPRGCQTRARGADPAARAESRRRLGKGGSRGPPPPRDRKVARGSPIGHRSERGAGT